MDVDALGEHAAVGMAQEGWQFLTVGKIRTTARPWR
jgi:hypothetical protein